LRLSPQIAVLPVQLPGRAGRIREKPIGHLLSLAGTLAEALGPLLDRPYAILGHSLGALAAFETTRELARRGSPLPVRLFVSSRKSPRIRDPGGPIHTLPDEKFVAEVRARYGGIPEPVLREPELMKLLLPSLRGDFEMLDGYEYVAGEPLECPVVALRGQDDVRTPLDELEAWGQETLGPFSVHELAGGHFYFQQSEEAIADLVRREIEGAMAGAR
jgi:surfactin synthase thioesterase subunit